MKIKTGHSEKTTFMRGIITAAFVHEADRSYARQCETKQKILPTKMLGTYFLGVANLPIKEAYLA